MGARARPRWMSFPVGLSNGPPPSGKAPNGRNGLADVAAAGVAFIRTSRADWNAQQIDAQIAAERTLLERPSAAHSCAAPHGRNGARSSRHPRLPSRIGGTGPAHGAGANHGCRRMREVRRVSATREQPIPAKVDQRNELPAIRSNPHSYRDPAASDGLQPILTRSPVGPFMPRAVRRRSFAYRSGRRCRAGTPARRGCTRPHGLAAQRVGGLF
jgi:hypothetical protein